MNDLELPAIPSREQIQRLENEMRKLVPIAIETTHYFAEGLYARQIFIPKGCLLTGKVHKAEHLNIVSQGEITVWTEQGMKRVKAPFTMVSKPGTKRVGLAHEDTVWTTVHASTETNIELLEAQLTEPELTMVESQTCLS